jgi:hypothetical protein
MQQLQETNTALTAALHSEQQAKTEALHRLGTVTQVQVGSVYLCERKRRIRISATDCIVLLILTASMIALRCCD